MGGSAPQIVLYLLAGAGVGMLLGWLICRGLSKQRFDRAGDEWQCKFDLVTRQKDRAVSEIDTLRSTIEKQQAQMHQHDMVASRLRTDLESAREKEKLLTKNIFTLRSEREETKSKMAHFQKALLAVKQQSADLQNEFVKSGDFYKSELAKSFEKRKVLEAKLENAKKEHESFDNQLKSTRSEHVSVNNMLASAQARLASLDALEQKVIVLEAENAELDHKVARAKMQIEVLERDVMELDELKVQNKELAHCLKSMETSRRQYEEDAKRYREHAGEQEQQSETLRIKLDEVEKNFLEMEMQQRHALREVKRASAAQKSNGHAEPVEKEVDDLKEIVGIGKAFEQTLRELGVHSFRQIANFGMADIARVNMQLKEFKGRMEQDDWIGQAKELLYKKYGGATEH